MPLGWRSAPRARRMRMHRLPSGFEPCRPDDVGNCSVMRSNQAAKTMEAGGARDDRMVMGADWTCRNRQSGRILLVSTGAERMTGPSGAGTGTWDARHAGHEATCADPATD